MSSAQHELNLYWVPGACSLAPHIVLRASGLPFKMTKVDFAKSWSEGLEKLNPKKQVPFLEIEPGVIVTEIPAIFTAISQLAPEKHFLGETSMEVIRSYEWFNYLSGQVHARRFGVVIRPQRYVDDEKLYPMVRDMAKQNIREAFGLIEEKLAALKPVNGENFRAVDAHLFVYWRWNNTIANFDMAKDFPRYTERMAAVLKLKFVQEALQAEGFAEDGLQKL